MKTLQWVGKTFQREVKTLQREGKTFQREDKTFQRQNEPLFSIEFHPKNSSPREIGREMKYPEGIKNKEIEGNKSS